MKCYLAFGLLSQLPVWTYFDPLMVTDSISGDEGQSLEEIVDEELQKEREKKKAAAASC